MVEKLGNLDQVRIKAGDQDPYEWAEAYAAKLTKEKKEGTRLVLIPLNQAIQIPKDEIQRYNGGYLFLQKIYNELKLREICKAKIKEAGYIPSYTRTDLTDKLHEVFGFRTDYEIMVPEAMKKIFSLTKKA